MAEVFNMSAAQTDKLFLEYIMPGLNVEIRENTILVDRFGTDKTHMEGKYATFKALTAAPASARPSSSSTLPTAKQGTYHDFTVYMKRGLYAQLQFDGLAVAMGKGKGAVLGVVESELNAIKIQIANKMNRQYWGDGSGRLAQVHGAVSNSTSIIVNGPLFGQDSNYRTNPAMWLDVDQEIDVYDSSGNREINAVSITAITDNGDGTATLTIDTASTCSNDSYIFDHDTYASSHGAGTGVPMGLRGMISNADPYLGITQVYFQGVQRSTHTWNQAQTVNFSSQPISDAKLLELVMKCERYGRVKAILMNDIIWRSYREILAANNNLTNETTPWGGSEGIVFYGGRKGKIPLVYDTDAPDNGVWCIDDDLIKIYAPTDGGLTFLPGENGILSRVQGKDEFAAALVYYYNMGTPKPQALGWGYGVKHAAA